ncbi:MAG: helix-turn-helix domain-containing protein [Proteobacteria bacterium]|nr:helix-turn-helix domain-containing protein [Pseudomonadota bacterium]
MAALQGTTVSPHNTVLYESLGSLIKDYRRWRKISQERLAELIRVGDRELRNWEANRRRVSTENLHDISEVTGIPMQVCVALNAGQPIWYSLRKRLFMYSSLENAQFASPELFRHRETSGDNALLKRVTISKDKHIGMILSCHKDLYGSEKLLLSNVIKAATRILPDLNNIIIDSWNHYIGHQVCLPIQMDAYQTLKKQKSIENYINSDIISDIIALGGGVFFYYSTFGANISAASRLILDGARGLSKIEQKEQYLIASHTVTKESAIIQENAGMRFAQDYACGHDGIRSAIYEIGLDYYLRQNGPVGWILDQFTEEALSKNMKRDKFSSTVDKPSLIVDRNRQDNQDAKTPVHEACTNATCRQYGKPEKGNIVSNGTYSKKDGTTGRRFLCKECGKSFCSRTGTIFYDLRSPEEKVYQAIKLLAKGMTLKYVANFLGIKFVTVSHWLKIAARQREKIDAMLINEPEISRSELDAFWTFVKKNSLRQRAHLFSTKKKPHKTN